MQDYGSVVIATGDGRWRLELVPVWGGLSNRLSYVTTTGQQLELLAGHQDQQARDADRYFRGVPLYPFVNRLADGAYQHQGQRYQFPLNEPALHNSLHGFLWQRPAQLVDMQQGPLTATATLQWDYAGDMAAYPFPARIQMQWSLHSHQGLQLEFRVLNLHSAPVPLAIGWHPYFCLATQHARACVDDWLLQLPRVTRVQLDARQLPTGREQRFTEFTVLRALAQQQFDDCFVLAATDEQAVCTRLWSPQLQHGLELWQQAAHYPLLQVFIPPARDSIALEPVSGGINCFNSGEHLLLLASGATFAARCGVRIMQALPPPPSRMDK
jgi:aldose 1-epimerase